MGARVRVDAKDANRNWWTDGRRRDGCRTEGGGKINRRRDGSERPG